MRATAIVWAGKLTAELIRRDGEGVMAGGAARDGTITCVAGGDDERPVGEVFQVEEGDTTKLIGGGNAWQPRVQRETPLAEGEDRRGEQRASRSAADRQATILEIGRDQRTAIGREGAVHDLIRCAQRRARLVGIRVPELGRLVAAGRGERGAIGAPVDSPDDVMMPLWLGALIAFLPGGA
jgi:hypothetical protein